jgi:hypothetical protein
MTVIYILHFLIGFITSVFKQYHIYSAIIDGCIHVIIGRIIFYIIPLHIEYSILLEIFIYHVDNIL